MKGVKDNQTVPQPRPLAPSTFVGPVWTTTTAEAVIGAYWLPLASMATFQFGDTIAIMTNYDGGTLFYTTIIGVGGYPLLNEDGTPLLTEDGHAIMIEPAADVVVFANPLPSAVSNGSQVWNYTP